jgi:RIO-like serine/threonine protein kinase
MTSNGFKILSCIRVGVDSVQEICKVTKISKDDVKSSITSLAEQKFIATKGLLTFFTRKITANGIKALGTWSKFLGKDEDVIEVLSTLLEMNNDGRKDSTIFGT